MEYKILTSTLVKQIVFVLQNRIDFGDDAGNYKNDENAG